MPSGLSFFIEWEWVIISKIRLGVEHGDKEQVSSEPTGQGKALDDIGPFNILGTL
jgi:hypothetical protein